MPKARKRWSETALAYAFITPSAIFMLVFCVYPILYNVVLSMTDMTMMNFRSGTYKFVWFEQFAKLFNDPRGVFSMAFSNTLKYTVWSIVFQFLIGFLFALMLSKPFPLSGFLRGMMMLAWLLPSTVTGLLGQYLFSVNGVVNDVLRSLGIVSGKNAWLVTKGTALGCTIFMNIWVGVPYNMMLLSTGLTTIPPTVYESAAIDGANAWQRLTRITIPLLKPTMMSVLVLGFINTFKVFDLVYVMTGGGPVQSSEVLASLSYQYSITNGNFSMGSATANVLFVILFLLSVLYQRLIKNETGGY